jgi:hypothetical protein
MVAPILVGVARVPFEPFKTGEKLAQNDHE